MIDKRKYVFILGAGASIPYRFPSSNELYTSIRDHFFAGFQSYADTCESSKPSLQRESRLAGRLVEGLKNTSPGYIDKYLNVNKEFERIGAAAIAWAIYAAEARSLLPHTGQTQTGDWYNYLFRRMTEELNSADELLRIHENRVAFITFNYDRSFENFLFQNLLGLVRFAGKNPEEVAGAIGKIPILHVFGKVGFLPWEKGVFEPPAGYVDSTQGVINFGDKHLMAAEVGYIMRSQIHLMYEERQLSDTLVQIRHLIEVADRIVFLGFGYDKQNVSLLGIPSSLAGKRILGTAFGLYANEVRRIKTALAPKAVGNESMLAIHDCDCLELLRQHLE